MRKLLLILFILPLFAGAQVWQQNNLEYGHQFKGLKVGRALLIPKVETTIGWGRDTGAIYYRLTDSTVVVYTGSQWRALGGGGGGTWGSITGTLSSQTDLQNALNAKVDTARTLTINGVTYSLGANRTWSIDLQSVTTVGNSTTTSILSRSGFYVRNSTNTQTLIALDNNSDSHGELVIINGPSTIYSRLRHDYLTFSNSGFTHKIKSPATITADVDFTTPNISTSRTIPVSVTINGTPNYANTTTGDIDLGTISSATSLNNVGTGYDVAVQGTDGVKRLQAGWRIKLDTATSNVVKIAIDTTTQTLTDGATITFDANSGTSAQVTLGGNRTLAFSNFSAGVYLTLVVIQDGTGSRTLTLPAGIKVINGGAGAVTLTTAASSQDILTFFKIGTTIYCNYGKNYN